GMLTAILFGVIIVISVFGKLRNPTGLVRKIFVAIFAFLNLGMAGYNATNLSAIASQIGMGKVAKVTIGWGLYLTIIASVAMIAIPFVLGKKVAEPLETAAVAPEPTPEPPA
ncbi:hypothetical protein KKF84_04235, partial [Myxococcota bacterium]|nr:hypothetical protein [Myxococcota bacterium]